jgi:hypothetical protein
VRHSLRLAALAVLALFTVPSVEGTLLAQAAPLPDAKQIIAKFVDAIGGEKALTGIKSIRATGTFEIAGAGISGNVEILSARPNKQRQHAEVPGLGSIDEGFDGTVGWSIDPMSGPSLAKDRLLQQMKDDAEFDSALHKPEFVKSMTTMEKTEFDGHPAYKVKMVLVSGLERVEYFDVQSGFQIGSEEDRESQMGTTHAVTTIRDYKKFGAFMQPTFLSANVMGADQIIHVATFEYDAVPADAFALPPQIKALIK